MHTPGPWRLSERRDPYHGSPVYSVLADEHVWLADVLSANMESGAANARLIAAAPDLLDACLFAKGVIQLRNERAEEHMCNGDIMAYDRLSAAIDKARSNHAPN
jgi:hypothetical protein